MREMKDSGIEWIGKIPKEWGIVKFKYLHNGLNTGEAIDKEYWESDAGPNAFYTAGLTPIRTSYSNFPTWKETGENDLLLARNGTPYVYLPVSKAYYTDHIIRAAMSRHVNRRFIRYCLQQSIASIVVDSVSIPTWSATLWNNQILTRPSAIEQERIAAFLDAECAEIDAVLEKTRASIEEYKKLKQAVITQAVTKGIRGDRPMKDSGIEWIGDIPKEFETLQLKFLCKLITDGTHFSPSTVETGLPYITAGDVHGIGLDYNSAKRISEEDFNLLVNQGCQPLKGDVLLVKDGATTGRVGFVDSDVPCVILSSVAMLRPADNINGHYLMYLLASYFLQNQILVSMAGSAMPRITLTKLVKYIGLLSPLSEQQEIADYLDEKCADIDALVAKKQQYLTEIENYKKSLIYEYVTGKKEVKTSVLAD